jgi:hypothetical protein
MFQDVIHRLRFQGFACRSPGLRESTWQQRGCNRENGYPPSILHLYSSGVGMDEHPLPRCILHMLLDLFIGTKRATALPPRQTVAGLVVCVYVEFPETVAGATGGASAATGGADSGIAPEAWLDSGRVRGQERLPSRPGRRIRARRNEHHAGGLALRAQTLKVKVVDLFKGIEDSREFGS